MINSKATLRTEDELELSTAGLVDYFVVSDGDGERWLAPRQSLGNGIFRTPDDPTESGVSP